METEIVEKDVSSHKECKEVEGTRSGNIIDESICADIWEDNVTPIVSSDKNHDVYMYTEIFPAAEYAKLIHLLRMVTEEDVVVLHINTNGGSLDGCKTVCDAIKECKATTVCKLSGTVASAGTVIALVCDQIEMGDYCHWITHYYSGEATGKGNELKAQQEFMDREIERMFYNMHIGFFSKEEIEKIIDGKDRWLNKAEVLKRWVNKSKSKEAVTGMNDGDNDDNNNNKGTVDDTD